jgi:hypothetical protein
MLLPGSGLVGLSGLGRKFRKKQNKDRGSQMPMIVQWLYDFLALSNSEMSRLWMETGIDNSRALIKQLKSGAAKTAQPETRHR